MSSSILDRAVIGSRLVAGVECPVELVLVRIQYQGRRTPFWQIFWVCNGIVERSMSFHTRKEARARFIARVAEVQRGKA